MSGSQKAPKNSEDMVRFVENLKRQWMQTIDALVDPLMIVDKDYSVKKANQALADMGETPVTEVVGKKCYKLFADRDQPCEGCQLHEAATSGEAGTFELEDVREERFYEVTYQPLRDGKGRPDGVVHIYRDRTHARNLQQQLMQQEKLASIGLLAGGVAHEINNPLGGILIFSQMILKEMDKSSAHYEDVVEIEAATQRCKAIVENLLEFARQQPTIKRKDEPQEADVVDAIQNAIRFGKVSARPSGQSNHVEIVEDLKGKQHLITGDHNKLVQVFLNLIQNAIHAMPDGGDLSVRSFIEEAGGKRTGVYQVVDTGVGIPKKHLKQIFDPFFTTKDPGEGTGLGLAICYGIVQDMDGDMTVTSQVNQGSTFEIRFPLLAEPGKQKTAS